MLKPLFGSINRERVLLFLYSRNEGYAREIARFYQTDLSQIQKQLERLEMGNIVYSKNLGKTRVYSLNPRYPFLEELQSLLEKVLSFYPTEELEKLTHSRKRPRRKSKPL
ncbi:winged helix-turn-helix transcriptional regulator [bacterium]|nr:winged helix-turn-helix transcriptional regulator [bacterium]